MRQHAAPHIPKDCSSTSLDLNELLSRFSMQINVRLLRSEGVDESTPHEIAQWSQRQAGPLRIDVAATPIDLGSQTVLDWPDIFDSIARHREAEARPASEYVVLLVGRRNELNWFAASGADYSSGHLHGERRHSDHDVFVAVEDFSWITSCPGPAVYLHFVLKKVLDAELRSKGIRPEDLRHQKATGCLFDFCATKTELATKLRTADICPRCLSTIESAGIDEGLLRQIVALGEHIRRSTIATSSYLPTTPAFETLPFPLAVTKHRVTVEAPGLRRTLRLLDHFDSLVRYAVFVESLVQNEPLEVPDRPSLGWWVDRLAPLKKNDGVATVLRLANQGKVVKLRNELRGHGYVHDDDDAYIQHGRELEQTLTEIELALRPVIERGELVFVESVELADGTLIAKGMRLSGSNLIHPRFEEPFLLEDDGLRKTGEVALMSREHGVRFQSLHPWLRRATCPECEHSRVLVFDGEQYIDVFMGHRVRLADPMP